MASFSKASQDILKALRPWLGFGQPQGKGEGEGEGGGGPPRTRSGSINSASTTLLGSERSPSVDASKDAQSPSQTPNKHFKSRSKSLRSVASLFHIEEEKVLEVQDPLFEWGMKTPDRKGSRPALKTLTWSMSSTRSRRSLRTRTRGALTCDAGAIPPSATSTSQEPPPVLDVDIPQPSFGEAQPRKEPTAGESTADLATSGDSMNEANKMKQQNMLWATREPEVLPVEIVGSLSKMLVDLDDPYVDKPLIPPENPLLTGQNSTGSKRVQNSEGLTTPISDISDDRGYSTDVESNVEGDTPKSNTQCAKSSESNPVAPSTCDQNVQGLRVHFAATTSPHRVPTQDAVVSPGILRGDSGSIDSSPDAVKKLSPSKSALNSSLPRTSSLRKSLGQLHTKIAGIVHAAGKLETHRQPTHTYDADAENSESSPPAPSMGSKSDWSRLRTERTKRYHEAISRDLLKRSEEVPDYVPQLSRSPSCRSENKTTAIGAVSVDAAQPVRKFYRGSLRYAVEAIERLSAAELEDEALNCSSGPNPHFDRRDAKVVLDGGLSLTQTSSSGPDSGPKAVQGTEEHRHVSSTSVVSRQSWRSVGNDSLPSLDSQDPYEAGMRAAGFYSRVPLQRETMLTSYEMNEAAAQNSLLLGVDGPLPQIPPFSSIPDDSVGSRSQISSSRKFTSSVASLPNVLQIESKTPSILKAGRTDTTGGGPNEHQTGKGLGIQTIPETAEEDASLISKGSSELQIPPLPSQSHLETPQSKIGDSSEQSFAPIGRGTNAQASPSSICVPEYPFGYTADNLSFDHYIAAFAANGQILKGIYKTAAANAAKPSSEKQGMLNTQPLTAQRSLVQHFRSDEHIDDDGQKSTLAALAHSDSEDLLFPDYDATYKSIADSIPVRCNDDDYRYGAKREGNNPASSCSQQSRIIDPVSRRGREGERECRTQP